VAEALKIDLVGRFVLVALRSDLFMWWFIFSASPTLLMWQAIYHVLLQPVRSVSIIMTRVYVQQPAVAIKRIHRWQIISWYCECDFI